MRTETALASERPGGNAVEDRIPVVFYSLPAGGVRRPCVILLHPLGVDDLGQMEQIARRLTRRGLQVALLFLPYHGPRAPAGTTSGGAFVDPDVRVAARALEQSASDVSTLVGWLARQPTVNPDRIGVFGISLGAIVAHLAMGKDPRLSAGVALLGGGDLPDLLNSSVLFRVRRRFRRRHLTAEEQELVRSVDPLTYAGDNRPRRVLMIQGAPDFVIPPRDARRLWTALGRPPIRWVDGNHLSPGLAVDTVLDAGADYLQAVWDGRADQVHPVADLWVPTLKAGLMFGLDSVMTPAIAWEAVPLVRRRHVSRLHLDLGWSGRGPYVGLAASVNGYLDLGLARRFNGKAVRPFAMLRVTF